MTYSTWTWFDAFFERSFCFQVLPPWCREVKRGNLDGWCKSTYGTTCVTNCDDLIIPCKFHRSCAVLHCSGLKIRQFENSDDAHIGVSCAEDYSRKSAFFGWKSDVLAVCYWIEIYWNNWHSLHFRGRDLGFVQEAINANAQDWHPFLGSSISWIRRHISSCAGFW